MAENNTNESVKEEVTNTATTTENTNTVNGTQNIKKLDGAPQIICSKHGLINNGAFYIKYTSFKKDPENEEKTIAVDNNNIFCISCLNELYMKFQKENLIGKISVQVKYANEDEKKEENATDSTADSKS